MIGPFGQVISTRILRDNQGVSRGVGFARMESKEKCEDIIHEFSGKFLPGISTFMFCLIGLFYFFTARCTVVQNMVLRSHVVRLSVCLAVRPSVRVWCWWSVDCDHTRWKSWKLIAWTISPTPSLFVAERPSTYSDLLPREHGEILRRLKTLQRTWKKTLLSLTLARLSEETWEGASCGHLCDSTALLYFYVFQCFDDVGGWQEERPPVFKNVLCKFPEVHFWGTLSCRE